LILFLEECVLTGCVFTGGLWPAREDCGEYLDRAEFFVAADSGLLLARSFGLRPDYIVGDMDSLPNLAMLDDYDSCRVIRYPREKDYTDTELGLELAREKGCDRIFLVGGGGGRMDHFLALYSLFHRENPPAAWLTDRDEIIYVNSRFEMRGWKGREVSLFPLGRGEVRMRSRGLAWPLEGLVWRVGDIGISNIVTDDYAQIELVSGAVLLMRAWGRNGGT
ncbi:MAG: thiamine diphosphokinase, partial [Spirochaetales bacterium]|nr:thiamine diphosphokinase [Spirochaetales bacterium]